MKNLLSLFMAIVLLALPVRGADLAEFKSADELWRHIQQMMDELSTATRIKFVGQLEELRTATLEFEHRYADDPHRWDAKLVRLQVEFAQARIANRNPDTAALVAFTKEISAASDASTGAKADASFFAVNARLAPATSASFTNAGARAAVDADVAALRKNYPDDARTATTQLQWVDVLKVYDSGRAEAILRDLAENKDPRVAADAQQQLTTMQLQKKLAKEPLDLKFKAVDGAEIDLARLRGKVVLLDFWAVWCGPCRMEIPNVVATYNDLHKDGFEIVGISLDRDKEQLLKFTKTAGMTWPQYFDGKMWSNDISSRFGINAIPAMWLLDKKGIVRSTEARGDLTEQVKKLLVE
jgi:thiol-disulfide isomerase/thioredoxin